MPLLSVLSGFVEARFTVNIFDNPGEILIKDWAEYFEGVRGGYVFLAPDGGYGGGLEFAVFNSENGRELFKFYSEGIENLIQSVTLAENGIMVRYRRAYNAECLLYENTSGCWEIIKKELAINENDTSSDCRQSYEIWQNKLPQDAAKIVKYLSMWI